MARESSTTVAIRETCETISKPEFRAKVAAALAGSMVKEERYTRIAAQAIQQNEDLVKCDPGSLLTAVLKCAADGLVPDGREAAFVPFTVRGQKTVQYLPMIGGMRKKAAEHGVQISAYCVYQNDQFQFRLGTHPLIEHIPAKLGNEKGDLIGAYSVATDRDGLKYVEVMDKAEIDAIRQRSRAKDAGPWVTDYAEMARKTVARRNFKQVPLLVEKMPSVVAAVDRAIAVEAPHERTLTAPSLPELVSADAAFEDEPEPPELPEVVGEPEDDNYFQSRLAEAQSES